VLDWRYDHRFLQPRAAITAARARPSGSCLRARRQKLGARNSNRAAGNLQYAACSGAHALKVGRRESRNGVPDVLDARLRNTEREGGRKRTMIRFPSMARFAIWIWIWRAKSVEERQHFQFFSV